MPFRKYFVLTFLTLLVYTGSFSQFASMPPFTLSIEPVIAAPIPGLHSFAFAQSGSKWLIIGGRTNGLHGLNASGGFPAEFKNDAVVVIDTSTWMYYSADLNQLPLNIADPMRSANMQYIQNGNYLYMVGGYGYDSVASVFVSFPKLTAIHIDNMFNAVINSMPIASTIRQVVDTNLSVCGGELGKIGSDYYLMFGHNFGGRYDPAAGSSLFTQTYCDRIKKFNLADDGTTITLSGFAYQVDTNNFHRRDLNTGPIVNSDGSLGIGAYGGAFRKDSVLPFREPININASGTTINTTYQQVMNHYTCALMPVYDSVTQSMYTTFFGGISLYDYDNTTSALLRDVEVPFVDDITTLTVHPGGITDETILPVKLPGLLGSNAKFVHTQHLPTYPNEVIKIRQLSNTKILAGYILGGIRAQQGNFGTSSANDTIYRVYITPNNTVGIDEMNDITNAQLYPNPSTNSTTLLFNLSNATAVTICLLDINAKEIFCQTEVEMQKGNQKVQLSTSKLSPGIYICKIQSSTGQQVLKLIVGK